MRGGTRYTVRRYTEMAASVVLFIMSLAILSTAPSIRAEAISVSINVYWLRSDGVYVWGSEFEEGDTAILLCVAQASPPNTSFDSIEMQWLRHGHDDWVTIADHENIVYIDGRDRFSRPNLTINSRNATEYRMAISSIDRYDNGKTPRFGCEFGVDSDNFNFKHSSSRGLNINWNPPSTTCSGSILSGTKAKKGDEVSFICNVTDVDRLSRGSITLWNGEVQLGANEMKTSLSPGYAYNISYANTVTDDTANYVYMCRYSATGGYEEYETNCTFHRPLCVVDDLADPCPGSSSGVDTRQFLLSPLCIALPVMIMIPVF